MIQKKGHQRISASHQNSQATLGRCTPHFSRHARRHYSPNYSSQKIPAKKKSVKPRRKPSINLWCRRRKENSKRDMVMSRTRWVTINQTDLNTHKKVRLFVGVEPQTWVCLYLPKFECTGTYEGDYVVGEEELTRRSHRDWEWEKIA